MGRERSGFPLEHFEKCSHSLKPSLYAAFLALILSSHFFNFRQKIEKLDSVYYKIFLYLCLSFNLVILKFL